MSVFSISPSPFFERQGDAYGKKHVPFFLDVETSDMDICLSSYSLGNAFNNRLLNALDFPEFCRRELGIRRIEFFDPDFFHDREGVQDIKQLTRDHPHIRSIRESCEKADVCIVSISAQNDFTAATESKRAADLNRITHWIEVGAAVGARVIRINAGTNFQQAEGRQRLREALQLLAPKAKEDGIGLAIENHPRDLTSVADAESIAELAEEFPLELVGTCPDNGHIRPAAWEGCLNTLLRRGRAKHCHAKFHDFDRGGNEATIDYELFFRVLRRHQFDGAVSIELVPPLPPAVLVRFCITAASCHQMSQAGVPDRVLTKLPRLFGKWYDSADKLETDLVSRLGTADARKHIHTITKFAVRKSPDLEQRVDAIRKAIAVLKSHGATL